LEEGKRRGVWNKGGEKGIRKNIGFCADKPKKKKRDRKG